MTTEELCQRRQELLQELAWIELEIPRARKREDAKAKEFNTVAEYIPRVRRGDTIVFLNSLKK